MLCVSRWKWFQFSCVELIDLKIARPHELAKVINYRLIEDQSQTFNEGFFLPYCKLYNKCIWKKVWIFPLRFTGIPLKKTFHKQVANLATIAHQRASMFDDTIFYNVQRQVTLNLKQQSGLTSNTRYSASSAHLQLINIKKIWIKMAEKAGKMIFSDPQGQLTP